MEKARAARNRTITLTEAEREEYASRITPADSNLSGGRYADSIINGDTMSVLPLLPDGFADLVVVDPPYNLTKDFGAMEFRRTGEAAYRRYLRSWLPLVCRKLKPHGSLYLCGDWQCTAAMQEVLGENLTIVNRITWQREKGRGSKSNWKNSMEDIWFAVRDARNYCFNAEAVMLRRRVVAPYRQDGKPKDWEETARGNFRDTYPSNFWDDISVPFWSMPENTDHPTQKPEKLVAKLILASSNEGDMVFDPFLGSGTTAAVAKKLGRHYCGIELNREYCLLAAKRAALADADTAIQGYAQGVFWERNTAALQGGKRYMKGA